MIAIFPEIAVAAEKRDYDQLAILTRKYFCKDASTKPALDIHNLIKNFGIPVTKLSLREKGMIAVRDERGQILCSIAISDGLTLHEENFLLAHMLGHFLLHIQPRIARAEWSSSGFREEILPSDRYTHVQHSAGHDQALRIAEIEADRFAAALLMPTGMFKRAMEKLDESVAKVAMIFGVNQSVVEARRDEFDVIQSVVREVDVQRALGAESEANQIKKSEKRLLQKPANKDDTLHMVREEHHKPAPTPKAMAKQSYTSQGSVDASASQESTEQLGMSKLTTGRGMERLREIARMLDKSGR